MSSELVGIILDTLENANLEDYVVGIDASADKLEGRVMKEITDEEYNLFKKLTKIWFHTQPDKTGSFFICGEAGNSDEHGLPEFILV